MSGYDKIDTRMQGVHTLVALPQWYVNFNLATLLDSGTSSSGASLKDVALAFDNGVGWLKGVLSALRVQVATASPTKVTFVLAFASGTMDYYDITQQPPAKATADVSNLQFGFAVDLSLADLAANQSVPDDVKARVKQLITNLGQGAFTVQQLLMDFQNASLAQYDPTASVFPSGFPPAAVAALPMYLTTYLRQLSAAGGNILGYAIKVTNPGGVPDPAATFPPTSLDLATNQFRRAESGATALQPDLDTIDFLMMTGSAALPTNRAPWSGNFVVPGDDNSGWYGTVAVCKAKFIDGFVLPALAPLVNTYPALKDAKGNLAAAYDTTSGAFTVDALGGKWSTSQASHSHKTNTLSNDDAFYNLSINVSLAVVPGTNQIVIRRSTLFDVKCVHWYGFEGHAASSEFRIWYEVPLTITIELLGITNGQLQVRATSVTRQPDPNTAYGDPWGWDIVKTSGSYSIWEAVGDTMGSVTNAFANFGALTGSLPGIEKSVTDKLDFSPFVFPGGKQLFMRNPVFNNEGDLLVGLSYK